VVQLFIELNAFYMAVSQSYDAQQPLATWYPVKSLKCLFGAMVKFSYLPHPINLFSFHLWADFYIPRGVDFM
jgi:hypothetical protein